MYETSNETGEDRLIGPVEIQMVFDSEHNGARIVANKQAGSGGDKEDEEVANHLIAMQTEMDVVQEKVILVYVTYPCLPTLSWIF